jgi:hypothetical protein
MPNLRCPRCKAVVAVAPGASPVCSACGFGSAAQAAAPSPAAAPQGVATAPPPRQARTGMVVAAALVGLLVVAGLATAGWVLLRDGSSAGALSESEAESRLVAALAGMPDALSGQGGSGSSQLRKVTMEMSGDLGPEGFGLGAGGMEIEMEWGTGGVRRMQVSSSGGAFTFAMEVFCTDERLVMVVGDESYGSRPAVDGDPCEDFDTEDADLFGDDSPVPLGELEAEGADITRHGDGSLTAVLQDPAGDGVATVRIDSKGRVASMEVEGQGESEGMQMEMLFDYGSRRSISVPEPDGLVPAALVTEQSFDDAAHRLTLTVVESPQRPPLDEMEVRVLDGFLGEPAAAFPLDQASGTQGNVTYRFTDADADGRLSPGDAIVLSDPSWDWEFDADAVVYDVLADGEVNSSPMGAPGLGPAALALALAGLALAARRTLR